MTMMGPDAEKIRSMFSKVAAKYDQTNSVLSLGIHHLWKQKLVRLSGARPGHHILDCATGTGDLAIAFKKKVGSSGRVVGTDFCAEMLETAPEKARKKNLQIEFQQADVMNLPYRDNEFDISSISFGIRNVANPIKGLGEMARVTKPGGYVMVLEFGQMDLPLLGTLYKFYSEKVLPQIGGMITKQKDAYEYLQKSSAQFPHRERFLQMMQETGAFSETRYVPVSGGIAYIYLGKVQ